MSCAHANTCPDCHSAEAYSRLFNRAADLERREQHFREALMETESLSDRVELLEVAIGSFINWAATAGLVEFNSEGRREIEKLGHAVGSVKPESAPEQPSEEKSK